MMFLIHKGRLLRKFLSLNRVTTENRSWEKSHLIQYISRDMVASL